jgi:hypothetical protein
LQGFDGKSLVKLEANKITRATSLKSSIFYQGAALDPNLNVKISPLIAKLNPKGSF